MFDTRHIYVTQPRQASLFGEEVRALAALPLQTLTANMAATRYGERQNLGAIFNASSYDPQRRHLPTSVMHAWMMCRADQWGPVGPTTVNVISLSTYSRIKVLCEYTPALSMPNADYDIFQTGTPYYFNSAKLKHAAALLSPNNQPLAQDLFESYLWLATNAAPVIQGQVILVDVCSTTSAQIGMLITPTQHRMSQENFFTLMASQHIEEDMILSLALWPTTLPLLNFVGPTGTYVNALARRKISIPHYNSFDHLCGLMDDIQKPNPNIVWQNIANVQAHRTRLFYYINYFMRAYTINSLGIPFPLHKLDHTPGGYLTLVETCDPFCSTKSQVATRWRFQPWELLIAMGGTLSTKIKMATVPNSATSHETDAPLTIITSGNGFTRMIPTTFKDPLILSPAYAINPVAAVTNYQTPINAIVQPYAAHHEETMPALLLDRRGNGSVASNYGLSGIIVQSAINDFRKRTTIFSQPYQNQYLELGPL